MTIEIQSYSGHSKYDWDNFVTSANNGTLFHQREFLNYHPTSRFKDDSIIFTKSDHIISVMPAALFENDKKIECVSHPGASYGGLVLSHNVGLKDTFEIVKQLTTAKEIIMSNKDNSINYIELPMVRNVETKNFYHQVFGWEFTDCGPNYISFSGANIDGGFNGEGVAKVSSSGVLIVLYANDLNQKLDDLIKAGGEIIKPIFEFPGGKRFHFRDPNGNELAV